MKPNSCHNIPRLDGYYAQDGWYPNFANSEMIPRMVWIEARNTKECQYRKEVTDPRCEGCAN